MDRSTLLELLERSSETDAATLLKVKEEAKRQMREDPSPQNVGVFEKASRLLEARMKQEGQTATESFASVAAALEYLHGQGRKIRKSKLYNDAKAGFPNRQADGSFAKVDLDKYADTLPLVSVPEQEAEASSELAQRKAELENEKLQEVIATQRFKRQVMEGKYIPREQVELELASRAVVLESGIRQAVEMNVLDLIHLVQGDPRKSQQFLEKFEEYLNEALNQFASKAEFEVTFTDDAESGQEDETGE